MGGGGGNLTDRAMNYAANPFYGQASDLGLTGGGGKNTTTNVATPSPYDVEKANTARMLRNALFPLMLPQMMGMPTADTAKARSAAGKQNVAAASQLKLAPGSPQIMNAGGFGGPNSDMMNYAMRMFGQMPSAPGSSNQTMQNTPGLMDWLGAGTNLAMMTNAMGGFGGGGNSGGMTNAGEGYSYTGMPSFDNTPAYTGYNVPGTSL